MKPLASPVPMRSMKAEEKFLYRSTRYGAHAMTLAEELLKEIVQMTDNEGIKRKVREYFEEQDKLRNLLPADAK